MSMKVVGSGVYELTIRQEQQDVPKGNLLGFPVFSTTQRNFIDLLIEPQGLPYNKFRMVGEFIPNTAVETFHENEICHTERELRETIRKQAEELSRWRKYPTLGSSPSSMTMLDWLFYLRNEQIEEHTISALCDWLEEKGETVRLENLKEIVKRQNETWPNHFRQDLIYAFLKV